MVKFKTNTEIVQLYAIQVYGKLQSECRQHSSWNQIECNSVQTRPNSGTSSYVPLRYYLPTKTFIHNDSQSM